MKAHPKRRASCSLATSRLSGSARVLVLTFTSAFFSGLCLSAKIQARADAIVAESIVADSVAPATKELSAKIQQKADALVNKALVNSLVNAGALVNDRDIITGVASTQVDVRTQQMIRATDRQPAGNRTLHDISEEFGITEGTIRKRAKAESWPRDISERIQAKADGIVRKSLVRKGTIGVTIRKIEKVKL